MTARVKSSHKNSEKPCRSHLSQRKKHIKMQLQSWQPWQMLYILKRAKELHRLCIVEEKWVMQTPYMLKRKISYTDTVYTQEERWVIQTLYILKRKNKLHRYCIYSRGKWATQTLYILKRKDELYKPLYILKRKNKLHRHCIYSRGKMSYTAFLPR